jgi:hypothetical protein
MTHCTNASTTICCNGLFRFDIRPCAFAEYKTLAPFHYRGGSPGPIWQCYAAYPRAITSSHSRIPAAAAVILYAMPPLSARARNLATDNIYPRICDRRERARRINADIRTIARVIVHPTFRSLHLASKLVAATLPRVHTRYVEAFAVMGHFHPFFEHAGMTRIVTPTDESSTTRALRKAIRDAGLSADVLHHTESAACHIESLTPHAHRTLLAAIDRYFIQPRRGCFSSPARGDLKWLLPRIAQRLGTPPAYFFWRNPEFSDTDPHTAPKIHPTHLKK